MKRNHTVLVLLVAWSLMFLPSLASVAQATDGLWYMESDSGPIQNDIIMEDDGAPDDDSRGDPGDGTDGYGISEQSGQVGPGGGSGLGNSMILDGFILILQSLVKLVF